jgi:hypothetical protein
MKFILLVYTDPQMLGALAPGEFDSKMRTCISHAEELHHDGRLIESQMLEDTTTAKSVRIRKGRLAVTDGPFTETKEVLGGFNLIEAENIDEAIRMAAEFPWAETGCIEVRPVRDFEAVRQRVFNRQHTENDHTEKTKIAENSFSLKNGRR